MKYTRIDIKSEADNPKERKAYLTEFGWLHYNGKWIYPNDGKTTYLRGIDWYLIENTDEPVGEVDREVLLKLFKDFFTFHNDANEGYSGIDKLFNEWYESNQDKEYSEKLEIRQAIIKAHTKDGKCTISKYRINQLLEGAVWYRDWVRG